ncbi:MAG: winged helix-turn-helix domain-containing tetratricopeptide repeat protein [Candidatus Zhuqueibacterota bacterium]
MFEEERLIFHFADFMLDVADHRLTQGDKEIYLRPKSFETLVYLIARHGHLVDKNELLDEIWSGTIVTEATLSHCIEEIRRALADDAYHPRFLKTVPKIGYKFIGKVDNLPTETDEEITEHYSEVRIRLTEEKLTEDSEPSASETTTPEHHNALPISLPRYAFLPKIVGVVSIIILLFLVIRHVFMESDHNIHSLAVLPFVNINADPEQDYFVDGMTEELITELANISALRVISRTSIMRFKGAEESLPEIAARLGVDAVVEGSVLHSGNKVRVNAQLIHARTDQHLWAERYECDLSNVIGLQGEIARSIAQTIKTRLTPEDVDRLKKKQSISPEAHRDFLKGRYFWNKRTEDGFLKAIVYFNQAIELNPVYAQAYAGLANCYNLLYDYDLIRPGDVAQKARAAAIKAIEIDTMFSEGYASLAFVSSRYDWDWQGAEANFKRAIQLNENDVLAHHWYALHLAMLKRFDEAFAEITKAQELDPLSLIVSTNVGWILYFAGRYDEAEQQINKVLDMDPNFLSARVKLGWIYEQTGEYSLAQAEYQKALQLTPDDTNVLSLLGNSYALSGNRSEAQKVVDELIRRSHQRYISSYWIAIMYTCLGEKDEAFAWLNQACRERSSGLIWLNADPKLLLLRNDPRFSQLMLRIGFAGK